jgi:hypothetical protein
VTRRPLLTALALVVLVAAGLGVWVWVAISAERAAAPHPIERVISGADWEVLILDPQKVIDDVRLGFPWELVGSETAVANPLGNPRQLALYWVANPCETRPKIELRMLYGMAELKLDRHTRQVTVECHDVVVERGITMELLVDLPASKVTIDESN